jgi:hypothetical protein
MGLSVRVAGNTVYTQMHARAWRICGGSHEIALRNVPISITTITKTGCDIDNLSFKIPLLPKTLTK